MPPDRRMRVAQKDFKHIASKLQNKGGNLMDPFPNKKYGIIYADPPWSYSDKGCNG